MRWKEIVLKVEDILSTPRVDILPTKGAHLPRPECDLVMVTHLFQDDNVFATAQAAAVWEAIATCWSEDVFIPELGHRLWKLTLQVENHLLHPHVVGSEVAQASQQVQDMAQQ
jgi:conserved oligomeric Golgi complex subunit 2